MKRKNQIISSALKSEIMEAAKVRGSIVSEVAKNYNISPNLLYAWRSDSNKLNRQRGTDNIKNTNDFVELSLNKSSTQTPSLAKQSTNLFLQKASLKFNDFSFELEGNISSKKLVQLISILEEPC
jgi:transposase-like protein